MRRAFLSPRLSGIFERSAKRFEFVYRHSDGRLGRAEGAASTTLGVIAWTQQVYVFWQNSSVASYCRHLLVPKRFTYGFCTLEPDTEIAYKISNHISSEHYDGIRWNDPELGIEWPVS
jgi:hypothetical protein